MGAVRPAVAAFAAMLLTAGGCRCNSVDDRELPAASASAAVSASAPVTVALPANRGPLRAEECGPDIGGIDVIAGAPAVLLGELHGLAAAPAFTVDLACRLAFSSAGQSVLVALEIPEDEQIRLDAFLASEGSAGDRALVLGGSFWTGSRDGRSSGARLEMLERIRQLNRRGANIRVRAIDGAPPNRDEVMAKRVIAAANEKRGPVLVLVGNLHARTQPGGTQKWMGEYVRAALPNVVALDNRYSDGEAWICSPECGRHKVTALDHETDSRWRIERFGQPDEKGYAGVWRIGAARASEPAVPLADAGR